MSLRGNPVVERAHLPDGRDVEVRVGVAEDSYVARRELDTVSLELHAEGRTLAALNTVLDPAQDSEARRLVRRIVAGLESGDLEPSAGALEPLAEDGRLLD